VQILPIDDDENRFVFSNLNRITKVAIFY